MFDCDSNRKYFTKLFTMWDKQVSPSFPTVLQIVISYVFAVLNSCFCFLRTSSLVIWLSALTSVHFRYPGSPPCKGGLRRMVPAAAKRSVLSFNFVLDFAILSGLIPLIFRISSFLSMMVWTILS